MFRSKLTLTLMCKEIFGFLSAELTWFSSFRHLNGSELLATRNVFATGKTHHSRWPTFPCVSGGGKLCYLRSGPPTAGLLSSAPLSRLTRLCVFCFCLASSSQSGDKWRDFAYLSSSENLYSFPGLVGAEVFPADQFSSIFSDVPVFSPQVLSDSGFPI